MINPLRRTLAEGRPTLGYLVSMPSVQMVQALARTGVDWLMIDTEHAPVSIESVAAMVAATGGTPVTPLVRVPGVRPELVKPALDCGAFGVVFPQIATREEAEATVRAVRYAPAGQRGYGPTYAALRWGLSNLNYLKIANDEVLNVVLIESLAGVEALDDILKVDGPRRGRDRARRSLPEPRRGRPVRPPAPARGRRAGGGQDRRPRPRSRSAASRSRRRTRAR